MLSKYVYYLSFAIFLFGCPKDIPPPKNALQDPAELRNAIDARMEPLDAVRFKEVVLEYFGKDKRVKIRQLILVKKPTYLRIQTRLPGSEEILSLLVADGKKFAMHRRDTNDYFYGSATPENIGILLPVNLSSADLTRILFGGAPWDRFQTFSTDPAKLSWNPKTGRYVYRVENDGKTLEMEVRPTDFAVVEVKEKDANGKETYAYSTDDWKRTKAGVSLPTWIRFVWPDRDLDFSLTVKETQVNVVLPDLLFELEAPGGSRMVDVDNTPK